MPEMDLCRKQQRPRLSVNTTQQPTTFQQHLRSSLIVETPSTQQYHHHSLPRQHRGLSSHHQHLYYQQTHYPLHVQQQFVVMNPILNNHNQAFGTGYTSEDAKSWFNGGLDEKAYNFGPPVDHLANHYHLPQNQYGFRPLNSNPSFAPHPAIASSRINREHDMGIMSILPNDVDTSQWSPVSSEEVFNTPYGASSPSSIDTTDESPVTPAFGPHASFFDTYAATYGAPDNRFHQTARHQNFSHSTVNTSFGSFTSESSASSFAGSDFVIQPHVIHNNSTHPQPLRGLGIHHAHDDSGAPDFTGTALTAPGMEIEEDFSESGIDEVDDDAMSAASSTSSMEDRVRHERDQLLLDMRNQGFSYKEIKRRGSFTEAESTLRGRMRVLTKSKEQRVRRPVWQSGDVELLRKAVRKFAAGPQTGLRKKTPSKKMPWGRVSRWLNQNGASYPFAPATCAKKWTEVSRK